MICEIYENEELKALGMPVFDSFRSPETDIGEVYISESVISMWDFDDYKDCYTYINRNDIKLVIEIGFKKEGGHGKSYKLKKDFSNVKSVKQEALDFLSKIV